MLSNTNASLDAEAHEARAAKNRLQQDVLKMEQHVENLEGHTKWLEAEVAAKIEAAQQERRTVSTQVRLPTCWPTAAGIQRMSCLLLILMCATLYVQVVQLQQTITEAEDKVQQLERSERRLKERVAELQRSAEVRDDPFTLLTDAVDPFLTCDANADVPVQTAQQNLKVARDEGDSKEHIFNKELATAQKLYTLYKDASEERSRKVTELEGIIRELQKHLEVNTAEPLSLVRMAWGWSFWSFWAECDSPLSHWHRRQRRHRGMCWSAQRLAWWLQSRRRRRRESSDAASWRLPPTATCLSSALLVGWKERHPFAQ